MTSKHEESQDIEEQLILRLPQEQAHVVRKIIHSTDPGMKDKLKIGFASAGHHVVVQVEDVLLPAKLVNLPCAIESQKTVDGKIFHKTADISQMLICSAHDKPHSSSEEPVTSAHTTVIGRGGEKTDRKIYNWKHDITPPLKNAGKEMFQRTGKKDTESPSVDEEVKRLLRSDAEAVSVCWEVIADEQTQEIICQGHISGTSGTAQMNGPCSSDNEMLREMFDNSGSNSNDVEDKDAKIEEEDVDNQKENDGDQDEDDDDEDDEKDEEEEEEKEIDNREENLERVLQIQFIHPSFCETNKDYSSIITGIQKLIHVKEMKLQKIYKKAQRLKYLLRNVKNLTLRRHFQNNLRQLNILEKQKCEEIYHLQKQLKCYLKE